MKRIKFKNFLALAITCVMALSVTKVAAASTLTYEAENNEQQTEFQRPTMRYVRENKSEIEK